MKMKGARNFRCPSCSKVQHMSVLDSRVVNENSVFWRRRKCLGCGFKFTTLEKLANFSSKKSQEEKMRAFLKRREIKDKIASLSNELKEVNIIIKSLGGNSLCS